MASPHIERTILVFQRRTLLNPLPHINLSRVLFPRRALTCAQTMINMPLPRRDKISQIFLPAYLQLQSPYYFRKVVWSPGLDYFIRGSASCVPCVPSSFIQIILLSFSRNGIWKCGLAHVWMRFHNAANKKRKRFRYLALRGCPWFPFFSSSSFLWLHCSVEMKKKTRPDGGMKTDLMWWYGLILCIRHSGTFHSPLKFL